MLYIKVKTVIIQKSQWGELLVAHPIDIPLCSLGCKYSPCPVLREETPSLAQG